MLSKELILLLFDSASIKRWNDHTRPQGFTELDKQSHKMIIAYVLGHIDSERNGRQIDWKYLIKRGFAEFIQRVIVTDINPRIFRRIVNEKPHELVDYVLDSLEDKGINPGLIKSIEHYLEPSNEKNKLERDILAAAHEIATYWEFEIIRLFNKDSLIFNETKRNVEKRINEHKKLECVKVLLDDKREEYYNGFIDLCGHLRNQVRWAQTPRVPETSVLGHMLIVAFLSFLCMVEIDNQQSNVKVCDKRLYFNFFAALFHDLPEAMTRDIISPVKRGIVGLDNLVKGIEEEELKAKVEQNLPVSAYKDINYIHSINEFANKVYENGEIKIINSPRRMRKYNQDQYKPIDGSVLKACDELAAFVEAGYSIYLGIKSPELTKGVERLYEKYRDKTISDINFGKIFTELYEYLV